MSAKDHGQDQLVVSGKELVILFVPEDVQDLDQSIVPSVQKALNLFTDAVGVTLNGLAQIALCLLVNVIQNVQLMNVSMTDH